MRHLSLKVCAVVGILGIFAMARFSPLNGTIWPKLQSIFRKLTGVQNPPFNVLTATVPQLIALLDQGKITSVEIVSCYASQIKQHNDRGLKLKAVISVVPNHLLLEQAAGLDRERRMGKLRGPLHGIPFLAKDNMWTASAFGVSSSCGTAALNKSLATENADAVQKLLDAGLILLGKANLSELGGAKSDACKGGSSAAGGQGQSAYVIGGVDPTDTFLGHSTPAGSSSGSAVAVSAGMAPLALGTESDGSLIIPADRASVYAVKPTVGSVSNNGVLGFAAISDTIGPIGKSPADIALVLDVLLDSSPSLSRHLDQPSFAGLKIGFIDPQEWPSGTGAIRPNADYIAQTVAAFSDAVDRIEGQGATVHRNIKLRHFSPEDGSKLYSLTWRDYSQGFKDFTLGLIDPPVHSLSELAHWNDAHPELGMPPECPGQSVIEDIAERVISDEDYNTSRQQLFENNRDAIEQTMRDYDIDLIVGPPTGRFITVIDVAGYPVGSVPLGYAHFNGRPFGFCCTTRPNREDLVIKFLSAWHAVFGPPKPPSQMERTFEVGHSSL